MTNILMPVDGSDHDARTAAFLGDVFGRKSDTMVEVLHVAHRVFPTFAAHEVGFVPVVPSATGIERWEKGISENAEMIVKTAERAVVSTRLSTSTRITWDAAPEAIERVAEEDAIDLIAMGSRGRVRSPASSSEAPAIVYCTGPRCPC